MDNKFLTKCERQSSGERVVFSRNGSGIIGNLHTNPPKIKQMKPFNLYFILYIKSSLKMYDRPKHKI